jgi:RNA polymerase sigma-70 factor, ECF subfamily
VEEFAALELPKQFAGSVHREGASGTREDALRVLMAAYQSGDACAVEELVRRLSPSLAAFFRGSLASGDADDLLQECWLRIHRVRHTYRPSEPLLPWIFAIARHTRVDGYRRMRRRIARELAVPELPEPPASFAPFPAAEHQGVFDLLNTLPEGQREVLLMLKSSGMSLEEVARATSSTVGAVKQKAHRAYAKLRQLMGGRSTL